MTLGALALLDLEGSERFVLSRSHQEKPLVPAAKLSYETVVAALHDPRIFMQKVAGSRSLPAQDIPALQRSWAVQNGLLMGAQLDRLLWILQRFRADVEYDLRKHLGLDLGAMWRARRWREILDSIDRLPRATWTYQSMVNDPDYAEAMAEARANAKDEGDDEPPSRPLVESTPEVAAISDLIDAVNALRVTYIMANKKEGSPDPKIPPYPRPRTLLDTMTEKAKRKARWAAHESLADRVLTRRRQRPQEAPE